MDLQPTQTRHPSALRLVRPGLDPNPPRVVVDQARRDAARENRLASELSPEDARVILAARVADAIEGGKAAMLRPDRRRDLVAAGVRMGLRPFDANLVIAIVQDAARSDAAHPAADQRLALVRAAKREKARLGAMLLAASLLGALAFWGLTSMFR